MLARTKKRMELLIWEIELQIAGIITCMMNRKIGRERKRLVKKELRHQRAIKRILNWLDSIGCTGATGKDEYV